MKQDIARRAFLGRLGTAALTSGIGGSLLGAWSSNAAVSGATFGGSIGLELDQAFAGYLQAASGGDRVFEVTAASTGSSIANKSIGGMRLTPIEIRAGAGMAPGFYSAVEAFAAGKPSTLRGALVYFDQNRVPRQRLGFEGSIVGVALPVLDAASGGGGYFTVTLLPQAAGPESVAQSPAGPAPKTGSKAWSLSAYKIQIQGLEAATQSVSRIEGLQVKLVQTGRDVNVDAGNFKITVRTNALPAFYQWSDQCVKGQCNEASGAITLLTPNLQTQIAAIEIVNCSVVQITNSWETAADKVAVATVELYCEQLRFNLAGLA